MHFVNLDKCCHQEKARLMNDRPTSKIGGDWLEATLKTVVKGPCGDSDLPRNIVFLYPDIGLGATML